MLHQGKQNPRSQPPLSGNRATTTSTTITKSPFFRPSVSRTDTQRQQHQQQQQQQQKSKYVVIQEATPRGKHVYRRSIATTATNDDDDDNNNNTMSSSTSAGGGGGGVLEHKSTCFGAIANLVNAIVGAGIVGIPYALKQSGFVAGVVLIVFAAVITEKSLRLLVNTAKHVHVASYETAMEAAFGKIGFRFTILNMFIVAYGGMVSYLIIVKDTFSSVAGIDPNNIYIRRSILVVISATIILPLSCQRDMADLSFTSRISVFIDTMLVAILIYASPTIRETQTFRDDTIFINEQQPSIWTCFVELLNTDVINVNTIFVGLGVLSFAFVCQHSAFIIAGSLDKPTVSRWACVTSSSVSICTILALFCGIFGYIGYRDQTAGNILMNLGTVSNYTIATIAKLSLGISMLFVYPLDSMVVRHVLIVLFFEGRAAHDGNDDASILSRRDRRVLLTVALYLLAVIPAALFDNLGTVLALTGAIGGSCLSYIGPGALYLGIHGDEFVDLASKTFWGKETTVTNTTTENTSTTSIPNDNNNEQPTSADETSPLVQVQSGQGKEHNSNTIPQQQQRLSFFQNFVRTIVWYSTGMPIWCYIARIGNDGLQDHIHDMTMKSPHPIRIGDVVYRRVLADLQQQKKLDAVQRKRQLLLNNKSTNDDEDDDDDDDDDDEENVANRFVSKNKKHVLPSSYLHSNTKQGQQVLDTAKFLSVGQRDSFVTGSNDINQMIGKNILDQQRKQQQQQQQQKKTKNQKSKKDPNTATSASTRSSTTIVGNLEADPQEATPTWNDFFVAIFFITFGVIAMIAGIFSIFNS